VYAYLITSELHEFKYIYIYMIYMYNLQYPCISTYSLENNISKKTNIMEIYLISVNMTYHGSNINMVSFSSLKQCIRDNILVEI